MSPDALIHLRAVWQTFALSPTSGLLRPFAVDMSTLRHARLAFEPRTRGFVLRDVAVRLGPNGLDGVEFDVSNGGVIVAGYASTLDGARNFGQVRQPPWRWGYRACGDAVPGLFVLIPVVAGAGSVDFSLL